MVEWHENNINRCEFRIGMTNKTGVIQNRTKMLLYVLAGTGRKDDITIFVKNALDFHKTQPILDIIFFFLYFLWQSIYTLVELPRTTTR